MRATSSIRSSGHTIPYKDTSARDGIVGPSLQFYVDPETICSTLSTSREELVKDFHISLLCSRWITLVAGLRGQIGFAEDGAWSSRVLVSLSLTKWY